MMPEMGTRFIRFIEFVAGGMAALAALLTLAMSFWITYDVLGRNLFGWSAPWAFDLSEYALVWITFLAAPYVLLNDRHVRIEILVDAVPVRLQRILGIAVSIIAICICLVLAWRTGTAAYSYFERGEMMARIWRIPRIWPYIVVPVGSAFLALCFVVRLKTYATSKDPEADLKARARLGQATGE